MSSVFFACKAVLWVVIEIIKILIAVTIGVPAFIYQLVKTFIVQDKINKLK
ncbi:MAG: hypothetical protein NC251_00715 [Lachnoclostridium sp.]|nr:hypothetical protein [Lachnospira sp.]MCM1246940.1 hypothetical protein [Lachnoclostridium sp.]